MTDTLKVSRRTFLEIVDRLHAMMRDDRIKFEDGIVRAINLDGIAFAMDDTEIPAVEVNRASYFIQNTMVRMDVAMNGDKQNEEKPVGIFLAIFPYQSYDVAQVNFIANTTNRGQLIALLRGQASRLQGIAMLEQPGKA